MTIENKIIVSANDDSLGNRVFLNAEPMFEVSRDTRDDLLKAFEFAIITLNVLNSGQAPSNDPRYQAVLEHILDLSSKIEKFESNEIVGHLDMLAKLNNSEFIAGYTKDYIQHEYAVVLGNKREYQDSIEQFNQIIDRLIDSQKANPANVNLEFLIITRFSLVQIYLLTNNTLSAILEINKAVDELKNCQLSQPEHIVKQLIHIANNLESKKCYDYSLICLEKSYEIITPSNITEQIQYRSKVSQIIAKQGNITEFVNYETETLKIIDSLESNTNKIDYAFLRFNINYQLAEKGVWNHVRIMEDILSSYEFEWVQKTSMLIQLLNIYTLRGSYNKANLTAYQTSSLLNAQIPRELIVLFKNFSDKASFTTEFKALYDKLESDDARSLYRTSLNLYSKLIESRFVLSIKSEDFSESAKLLDIIANLHGLNFHTIQNTNLFCAYLKYAKHELDPETKLELLHSHQENKENFSNSELIALSLAKLNLSAEIKDIQLVEESLNSIQIIIDKHFDTYASDLDYGDVFVEVAKGLLLLADYQEASKFIFKFYKKRKQNNQIYDPACLKILNIAEHILSMQGISDLTTKIHNTCELIINRLKEFDR
jgi:hypothetical protein